MQTVFLSTLDGYQFEELCTKLLLNQFDRAIRTQNSNDFGKDIIAYKGQKKYVIECKHYISGGSIGRPIIQKLHSAMMHENTNNGIIITTSKLAQNALNYINDLNKQNAYIDIITTSDLIELAKKSNIHLVKNINASFTCKILPELDQEFLTQWYIREVKKILSTRIKLLDYFSVKNIRRSMFGLCEVQYSIDSHHSTSVMMHNIQESGKYVYLSNSLLIKDEYVDNIKNEPFTVQILNANEISNKYVRVLNVNFSLGNLESVMSKLEDQTKNYAKNEHTVNVSYYGKNNSKYIKNCSPKISEIYINGFQMIIHHEYNMIFELFGINYSIKGCIYSNGNHILSNGFDFISIYSAKKLEHGAICEQCHSIVSADISLGELYTCCKCKSSICLEHTYYKRNIFLKEFFCINCSQNLVQVSKKCTYEKRFSRLNKLNVSLLVILTLIVIHYLIISI